jgi:hypothetical protein
MVVGRINSLYTGKNMYDMNIKGGRNEITAFQARWNNFRDCGSFGGVLPLRATARGDVSLTRSMLDGL